MTDIVTTDRPDLAANELILAKQMAETLNQHYPGHLWAVNINGGTANIRNFYLSGKWGFVLKLPDQYSASEFKREVIRGGGELLERYNQRRGRADQAALASAHVDFAGRMKAHHD